MKQHGLIWCAAVLLCSSMFSIPAGAEAFAPGGSADRTAAEAYASWMQFSTPDTDTPAIDTDGCLNYALAKMSARYNLPVEGVDLLSDSYSYYTTFVQQIFSGSGKKMDQLAETYGAFLTREESVWLSGSIAERTKQAYAVCAETGTDRSWCYVLQMTTASGSDHYVLVDDVDTEQEQLWLLDSGSRYVRYLGDAMSLEKGYAVTAVHPFRIWQMPGDTDGDFRLTQADAACLLRGEASGIAGDADHNGVSNAADAVFLAQVIRHTENTAVQYAMQTEIPAVATAVTAYAETADPSARWNGKIFQRQLRGIS